MKLSERANIPPQVMTRTLGDEVVVLDLATGTYFGLDLVGAEIWELMGKGCTFGEICEQMLDEYAVTREDLESDILALAKDLESNGLISASA